MGKDQEHGRETQKERGGKWDPRWQISYNTWAHLFDKLLNLSAIVRTFDRLMGRGESKETERGGERRTEREDERRGKEKKYIKRKKLGGKKDKTFISLTLW